MLKVTQMQHKRVRCVDSHTNAVVCSLSCVGGVHTSQRASFYRHVFIYAGTVKCRGISPID